MPKQNLQFSTSLNKSPDEVIAFLADVRNRQKYQPSLTAVDDIQGEPTAVGSSWNWKWSFSEHQFQGAGKCVEYEAGKRYAFTTEGDIASRFNYKAEPAGEGTKLTVDVEFEIPAAVFNAQNAEQLGRIAREKADESLGRLKAMLEG